MTLQHLTEQLRRFADERDWGQFHTPKNLAAALVVEASELLEIFQWLTPEQSYQVMDDPDIAVGLRHEIADILAYLLQLSRALDIDPEAALIEKIQLNATRYPVGAVRGKVTRRNQQDGPRE